MLRISRVDGTPDEPGTLRVEGRLVGPWVEELRREARALLGGRGSLVLELGSVTYADAAGEALLGELVARGARIGGCSTFIAELLGGSHAARGE
jgi:hypothetical protein